MATWPRIRRPMPRTGTTAAGSSIARPSPTAAAPSRWALACASRWSPATRAATRPPTCARPEPPIGARSVLLARDRLGQLELRELGPPGDVELLGPLVE